jgi:hypothetical protein
MFPPPRLQQEVQASGGGKKDDRSVEALLQFIDGAAGSKKSKSKKKKKKGKRDEAEDHTSEDVSSSPLRNDRFAPYLFVSVTPFPSKGAVCRCRHWSTGPDLKYLPG